MNSIDSYKKRKVRQNNYYRDLDVNRQRRWGAKKSRNNMQMLIKRKTKFKQKTRKRKFKLRVTNKHYIRRVSYKLGKPSRPRLIGFVANRACRLRYPTLLGIEKAVMPTKQKV